MPVTFPTLAVLKNDLFETLVDEFWETNGYHPNSWQAAQLHQHATALAKNVRSPKLDAKK